MAAVTGSCGTTASLASNCHTPSRDAGILGARHLATRLGKQGISMTDAANGANMRKLIDADLQDTLDEEIEMELDDHRLQTLQGGTHDRDADDGLDRQLYFKELLRLQGELVKLQDWVQQQKLKVVVIFEGRDSAGKGGVIKRITQRLNPRICRVAALPAPS